MKKLRLLKSILIRTHTTQILLSYLLFLLADALVIQLADPHINTYRDALWVLLCCGFYCRIWRYRRHNTDRKNRFCTTDNLFFNRNRACNWCHR